MAQEAEYKSKQCFREALRILEELEIKGFAARLAGGCVRDRVLQLNPKDYDIATVARPEQICSIFRQKGYKVVPTGIDHGTVTIVGKFGPYEATTLRKDIKTDGRHAEVVFGSSFEEDAARRDFTFNAMFEDRNGVVYDYFLGRKHLENKELHFVGDPRKRIQEDYLRILRMYRFWARLGCQPGKEVLQIVTEIGSGLARVSQERITAEILKLLGSPNPWEALKHLFASQLTMIFLPDGSLPTQEEILATKDIKRNLPLSRLAIILKNISDYDHLQSICHRLRLSNRNSSLLSLMCLGIHELHSESQSATMSLIDRCETIEEGAFLASIIPVWTLIAPEKKVIVNRARILEETKNHIRKAVLPVSSKDIMLKFNMIPGPELGDCLKLLKRSFRDEKWNDRKSGLEWLAKKKGNEINERHG